MKDKQRISYHFCVLSYMLKKLNLSADENITACNRYF